MTAQIISLADYRNRRNAATDPAATLMALLLAARTPLPAVAGAAGLADSTDSREATIVVATAALNAACREMAANLAMLMSHAEAACHSIGDIGDTAEALVKTGAELRQVADTFKQDHDRMSSELSSAGLAGQTP
jgi:hypothetical protein